MTENNNNRGSEAVSEASESQSVLSNAKPNCYKCVHRGGVPGSAHSSCDHPSNQSTVADPFAQILATIASIGRIAGVDFSQNSLNVTGNRHGIDKGWFNWPHNFDPVWLETCDGFKQK